MSRPARSNPVALVGGVLLLAIVALALAGSVGAAELVLAGIAGGTTLVYRGTVARRARATFRPPTRWWRALAKALPQLVVESALLSRALIRQLTGGAAVRGADDSAKLAPRGVDAATAAIAGAAYPCLTPNTVVRAVGRGRVVCGRRLLDSPGHRLSDDLARLT